jgi:hypothetical protein
MHKMPPDDAKESTPLSDDQKATVSSILSNYDPSKLTADDAKAINQAFKDAGLPFGKALGDAIENAGFSVKTLRSLDPSQSKNPGMAESDAENRAFSGLIKSLDLSQTSTLTSGTSADDAQNSAFSDLIKSLSSSDKSNANSLLSDLVKSLQSAGQSGSADNSDEKIKSLINGFLSDLQNSTNYSQQGSLSVNTTMTQSMFTMMA